jgi:hypothetical protein
VEARKPSVASESTTGGGGVCRFPMKNSSDGRGLSREKRKNGEEGSLGYL